MRLLRSALIFIFSWFHGIVLAREEVKMYSKVGIDPFFGMMGGLSLDASIIDTFIGNTVKEYGLDNLGSYRVLEIGDDRYSSRHLTKSEVFVLDYEANFELTFCREEGSLKGDLLCDVSNGVSKQFDIIIITQTLSFIKNPFIAASNLAKLLRNEKSLIIGTEPFLSPISLYDYQRHGDYFRFTDLGIRQLYNKMKVVTFPLGNFSDSINLILGHKIKKHELNKSKRDTPCFGYIVSNYPIQ